MSFTMPSLRHILTLSAAATLVAAAAFAMTTTAPSAHAATNRRFCMYVNGEYNYDQKTSRYVVVNYTKDRKCPSINSEKYPKLISYANPVPKETCEQVSIEVEFELAYYDNDLCKFLYDDIVYELFKPDGKKLDLNTGINNRGNVSRFQ